MGKFSRQQTDDIFLICPDTSCKLSPKEHEVSNPIFWEKWDKYSNCRLLKFLPSIKILKGEIQTITL